MPETPATTLELKVPPLLVMALLGLVMWLIAKSASALTHEYGPARLVAIGSSIAGLGVIAAGVWAFRRAQTTVDPTRPGNASAVVTGGIYRFTRNPMYLGMLLMLLAWAALLQNVLAFAIAPLFIFYMNRFQILPEERFLRDKFGAPYEAYLRAVRRWL
jgi:protein-S-isoprenylcysteine O-methyltransferase Ste14